MAVDANVVGNSLQVGRGSSTGRASVDGAALPSKGMLVHCPFSSLYAVPLTMRISNVSSSLSSPAVCVFPVTSSFLFVRSMTPEASSDTTLSSPMSNDMCMPTRAVRSAVVRCIAASKRAFGVCATGAAGGTVTDGWASLVGNG